MNQSIHCRTESYVCHSVYNDLRVFALIILGNSEPFEEQPKIPRRCRGPKAMYLKEESFSRLTFPRECALGPTSGVVVVEPDTAKGDTVTSIDRELGIKSRQVAAS